MNQIEMQVFKEYLYEKGFILYKPNQNLYCNFLIDNVEDFKEIVSQIDFISEQKKATMIRQFNTIEPTITNLNKYFCLSLNLTTQTTRVASIKKLTQRDVENIERIPELQLHFANMLIKSDKSRMVFTNLLL